MKTNTLILNLTDAEIALLRESVSRLGIIDKGCVTLQLKIANAILDSGYLQPPIQQNPYEDDFTRDFKNMWGNKFKR